MIKNVIFAGDPIEIPSQIETHRRALEISGKKVISVETYRVENGGYYIIEICNNGPKESVEISRFIEDEDGNIYKMVYYSIEECDNEHLVNVVVQLLSDADDEKCTYLSIIQHDEESFEWILTEGSIAVWNLVDKTISISELKKVFDIKFN